MTTRRLGPGDETEVDAFLVRHTDTAMFLRSNLRAVGLGWSGRTYEGHWVARTDERGAIAGVVCHTWIGNLLVQDDAPAEAARAVVALSERPVIGLAGPHAQVIAARAAVGLADRAAAMDDAEVLMTLALEALIVPRRLAAGELTCRRAADADRALLADWRHDYLIEALNAPPGDATRATAAVDIARGLERGSLYVVEDRGTVVATTGFNAMLPDVVQVGGVFTPPASRGRGLAQAAVAGSLLDARGRGVARAVLFADRAHPTSTLAYRKIGFADAGEYAMVLF